MVSRYRKLPVEIEAMKWDGTAYGASDIIDWILHEGGTANYHDESDFPGARTKIAIDTLEGTLTASPGDFIIKGIAGEFYACKPDIFFQTYEEVS